MSDVERYIVYARACAFKAATASGVSRRLLELERDDWLSLAAQRMTGGRPRRSKPVLELVR